ncbi:hypothetical protein D3C72_1056560 [compost metagenome]
MNADSQAHQLGERVLARSVHPVIRRFRVEGELFLDLLLELFGPLFVEAQDLERGLRVQQVGRPDDVVLVQRDAALDVGVVAVHVAVSRV